MKNTLRTYYKNLRQTMPIFEITQKSHHIIENLFSTDFYQKAKALSCYLSFRNEVITDDIFRNAWQLQKLTAIPISHKETHTITLSRFDDFSSLELSSLAIRELPFSKQIPFSPNDLDLCIIPGIAFDRYGNRLGFGQGYYDRFLPQLNPNCIKIALAFSEQIHEGILPFDSYDIPMDYIITEKEILSCLK